MGLVGELAALVEAFCDLAKALLADPVLAVLLLLGALDDRVSIGMGGLAYNVQRFLLVGCFCLNLLFFGLDNLYLLFFLDGNVELQLFVGGLDGPIIHTIHFYLIGLAGCSKQALQVLIIRFLLKLEPLGIIDKRGEFVGKPFGQKFSRSGYLLLHDHFILSFGVLCLHVLPWQDASQ